MNKTKTTRSGTWARLMVVATAAVLASGCDHLCQEGEVPSSGQRTGDVAASATATSLMTVPATMNDANRYAATVDAPRFDASGGSDLRLEERTPDELVAQALGGATVTDRAAALDALAYAVPGDAGKEDYVSSTLIQALVDPDERIRGQALATLKDAVQELPGRAVAQVARDDPSPALRIQALELLVERNGDEALDPLRLALADPDPEVHDRARELIGDLHLTFEAN